MFDAERASRQIADRVESHRRRLASSPVRRLLHERLARSIPFVPLADGCPTPFGVVRIGGHRLWVKRDDLTSSLYGGNKARKLEYVLAAADRRPVVVMGGDASHHLVAAALHGLVAGVPVAAVTFPQPRTPEQDEVAQLASVLGVRVFAASGQAGFLLAVARALWALRRHRPILLYPGGSSPVGDLGYVDCGLEIAADVRAGIAPEPDVVYTALGTGGTAVGLAAGLALGGLHTQVRAVRVTEPLVNNRAALTVMRRRLGRLLQSLGIRLPRAAGSVTIVDGYLGRGYGYRTSKADDARTRAEGTGLSLDPTYTAKALAAALDHVERRPQDRVAFLDTMSSVPALTHV